MMSARLRYVITSSNTHMAVQYLAYLHNSTRNRLDNLECLRARMCHTCKRLVERSCCTVQCSYRYSVNSVRHDSTRKKTAQSWDAMLSG